MSDLSSLAAIAAAFVIVTVSPGPANLGCASVAMARGRKVGVQFALGLALGLTVWGLLAAAGMGAVLEASEWALMVLKLLGGAYLLYLAWSSARSAVAPKTEVVAADGTGRWFYRGLLLNLTNPKAVFAWLAALAVGLDAADGLGMVAIATAICAVIGVLNYLGWAFVFSTQRMMAVYLRVRRWIDGAVAALFAAAGLGLIRSALARSPG